MFKKIPSFAVWLILAVVAITVPLACGSSTDDNTDGHSDRAAVDMTSPG
jgi:hypothetical protein